MVRLLAFLIAFWVAVPGMAAGLDEARSGQAAQRAGDSPKAIEHYRRALAAGDLSARNAATVHNLLGRLLHDRRDFAGAEQHHIAAGRLDAERFRFAVVPVWDELDKWAEVIALVEPAYRAGSTQPSELGALLTAYWKSGRAAEAREAAGRLSVATFNEQWMRDYQHYVLAYWELYNDRPQAAKAHIRRIKDPYYRRYMRGSHKFGKLSADPEFLDLTK